LSLYFSHFLSLSFSDVAIKQIFFTAQLNKDRRKGQQNAREKELLALVREPTNKRSKDNEYAKAQALANDVKNISAHECVMRYADIIKDNQTVISLSKGDTNKIQDLIPYVESLIWGCHKLNIQCIDQFENFLLASFGPETQAQLLEFKQVTPELQAQFDSILPSEREVKLYLIDFCNRNGITLETMQEVGHSLSPTELSDLPEPSTKPPHDNQQPQNPYNPGNFPNNQGQGQGQGGFSNFPNNHPQGGNFPQYGYPGGLPQQGGSYPQFVGYPQGSNPHQGGLSQPGFPHQPNFPSQQGQSGFPGQQGQSGFPNNQGGSFNPGPSQAGPKNTQSQLPEGNENIKNFSNIQGIQQQSSDLTKGTQTSAAYPDFQRFSQAPVQAGGVKGTDDLDDLDAKLKNIRNGL